MRATAGIHRTRRLTGLVILAGLATACSVHGLSFREDNRVEIIFPEDEAVAREPVEIDWEVEGFDVTGPTATSSPDAGYFGVFLDRFPQPPGKTVSWLIRNDEPCRRSPVCPNDDYYAARGIFTTEETNFTLPVLPRPPDSERAEVHNINIVLLDGTGRRIGEGVWIVDFELEREDA